MARPKRTFQPVARRLVKQYRAPIKRFGGPVGELVWASNHAHGAFFLLFMEIVSPDPRIGEAIWNALRNDAAQRDILLGAAIVLPDTLYRRIEWMLKKAGELSAIRNDAVHTPMMFVSKSGALKPVPTLAAGPRMKRVSSYADINRTYRAAMGDFIALSSYAVELLRVYRDPHGPWPNRPRLRSR